MIRQGSANPSRTTIRTVRSACVLNMSIVYDSPVNIVLARQASPIRSITNAECQLVMCACINTHKHIHKRIHTHIHTHTWTHIHTYINIYIYIYIYMHIHMAWYNRIVFGEIAVQEQNHARGDGKQRKAGREMRQTWALWNREFQLGGQREQGTGRERGRYRYRQEH